MINAVFFDLDGTLADTAPDLAAALNIQLGRHNKPELPYDRIRPVVSHGGNALIKLGFEIEENDPEFAALRNEFLEIYQNNLCHASVLFPGMEKVISELENKNITWGIITNKPGWLTEPLIIELGLDSRAACVISGDSTEQRKPHPAPMELANQLTGTSARHSLYIGDAERDIQAGKSAGMYTLVALYGYISNVDNPRSWQADGMIEQPADIISWISCHSSK